MEWAISLVKTVFEPALQKNLDAFNEVLSKRGLRAGIDIKWYFDKEEVSDESV